MWITLPALTGECDRHTHTHTDTALTLPFLLPSVHLTHTVPVISTRVTVASSNAFSSPHAPRTHIRTSGWCFYVCVCVCVCVCHVHRYTWNTVQLEKIRNDGGNNTDEWLNIVGVIISTTPYVLMALGAASRIEVCLDVLYDPKEGTL